MHKSSLYLPERLKSSLAARSMDTGISEAALIRQALESFLAEPVGSSRNLTDPPLPGRLVGVGVGPGDPELLTTGAIAALRRADRVLAPSTAIDAISRAEAIVREAAPGLRVERITFTMAPERETRDRDIRSAAEVVSAHLDAGREVAWITLGDPLVYSTFPSVSAEVRRLRPSTVIAQIPGIMAFQALASRTGIVVADERDRVTIRTALAGDDLDADLDDPGSTVVIYKGGRRLPELAQLAASRGRAAGAVAGELIGMAGERVGALRDLASDGPASYLATVILPAQDVLTTKEKQT